MRKTLIVIVLISLVTIAKCVSPQIKENRIDPKTDAERLADKFKGEKNDPGAYQTIFIHTFRNLSSRGILSSRLKEKLKLAYARDGKLQVSSEKKAAKVWLYGSIVKYQKIPTRFNRFNQTASYRLGVVVTIRLVLNPNYKKEVLLNQRPVRYDTYYDPLEIPFESEFLANERLLDGLVDRIVYTSFEGWYSKLKSEEELNKRKTLNIINNKQDFIRKDLPKEKRKKGDP